MLTVVARDGSFRAFVKDVPDLTLCEPTNYFTRDGDVHERMQDVRDSFLAKAADFSYLGVADASDLLL
jgi:hypothetical protein